MLLDKISEETISSLCEKAKEGQEFDPEGYSLFFQYDTAAGTMNYYAVRKDISDDTNPLGYFFSIGADLSVHHGAAFPWLPLLLYLREYEKGLSDAQQKEIYGDAYYTLGSVAGLSPKELANREKARRSFLSFLDKLQHRGLLVSHGHEGGTLRLQIELTEFPGDSKPLSLRLKMGNREGRMYYIQSAHGFCHALREGSEFSLRPKFSVRLSPDAFEKPWQPLMDRFLELVHPDSAVGHAQYFLVSRDKIPAFLSLLPEGEQGDVLSSAQGPWRIETEDTPASVHLDSAGTLTLTPALPAGKGKPAHIISGNQMVLFYPDRRVVTRHHFEEILHAELYQYFADRPHAEVSYVSDLLAQRILPVASGLIHSSEKNDFRITIHISLEEDALLFQTRYWTGEEERDSAFFEGKPFEQALIRSCTSVLRDLHGVQNGKVQSPEDLLFFLRSDLAPLRQVADVYLDERLKQLKIRNAPAVQIQASRSRGWLNLSFHSSEYSEQELEAIYAAYRKKKAFFLLKNDLILLDAGEMAPVENILEESGAEKSLSDVRLPFYHVMLLEGYREAGADISMDEWVTEAITKVAAYKSAHLSVREDLKNVLRPYQADGIRWMRRLAQYGFSGILADDMGLGKTLEVLAFLSSAHYDQPVLVVCPKSLVYNWRNEIGKWLPDAPVEIIAGTKNNRMERIQRISSQEKTLYITGYDSLRADIDAYEKKQFYLVLADEAQNIKNALTQRAKAIRKLNSGMRLALTGTPVENSLTDLWSIFDFLMPGYLGSASDFREKYESDAAHADARTVLARKVQPFLLRRAKEDVLDSLPGKEVILTTISMTDEQRRLYEAYLHKARKLAQTEKGVSVFSALTRLRQICVDPSVFLEDYTEMPAKLSVALDVIISSIEGGHRVLVFSSFTKVLEHFRYYLEEKEIRSYYISGDTPGALRVDMAEKFNSEDRVKVMLISIKAGGTGLNLIGADIVIHLDPWWNFAVEEQATDRAYRIGQTKPVTVYKLIAHDSVEEKVVSLQEEKRQVSSDVVQTSLNGIDTFSPEDIRYILQ